jgi:hypothetical protein
MSEDGTGREGVAGSPSQGPGVLLPPSPCGDLALRHACQCFGDALGKFIELRRSATADPEGAEQSDTTRLAAARRKWSEALSELSVLRATTWGGLQARYDAWMRLESEFGDSDGRVFELAVDLVRNTYALAWENKGNWISARRDASDFASSHQRRSTFPSFLSRVGESLPVFALRGRRSQT